MRNSKQEMAALDKQLDTLKTIVPEEKETTNSCACCREPLPLRACRFASLTAQTVVSRDYHYEMPFTIQVDGPYFSIEDFFARLSRLSRIINVGDLRFDTLAGVKSPYPVRPSTTVTGTCTVTTFFTTSASAAPPPGPKRPAAAPRPVN